MSDLEELLVEEGGGEVMVTDLDAEGVGVRGGDLEELLVADEEFVLKDMDAVLDGVVDTELILIGIVCESNYSICIKYA